MTKDNTTLPELIESGGRLGYYYINIIIFIAVPFLLTKYNQNPKLIGVLIGILIFVFLPINCVEYFFAEEEKLVVMYKRIFFLQFLNRKRIFRYNEIEKITAILRNDERTDITAFFINLTTNFTAFSYNTFEVQMKNGKKRYINSKIYIKNLLPLINYMQNKGVDIKIIYPNNKDI